MTSKIYLNDIVITNLVSDIKGLKVKPYSSILDELSLYVKHNNDKELIKLFNRLMMIDEKITLKVEFCDSLGIPIYGVIGDVSLKETLIEFNGFLKDETFILIYEYTQMSYIK